jgi:uroporphyrinogen III methyltransferase/synthase
LDAGVEFEEVPGISSAIAGPAYAGIPLTHRAFASSVTLITGHEDPDKPGSAHNWQALAAGANTLVFVMGMKNLPEISRKLIEAGLRPDTPAALIHWGTTPRHRSLISTLEQVPQEAVEHGFTNPSLIVVGGVVSLHARLNWFEKKPLIGRGVVVTRAREQARGRANMLTELGAEVIQFPAITISPLADYGEVDAVVEKLENYDWLIFTSVNGVRHFWRRLAVCGKDSRAFGGRKVAAIGPATAEELRARGIEPDFLPEKYVAEGIVEGLLALGMAGKRVLVPRAREAREVLPEELRKAGALVDILPVYQTLPAEARREDVLDLLREGRIHCVTFASSSTVDNFLSLIPADTLRQYPQVQLAAIGPITKKTLERHGLVCHIMPEDYTIPALVESLKKAL